MELFRPQYDTKRLERAMRVVCGDDYDKTIQENHTYIGAIPFAWSTNAENSRAGDSVRFLHVRWTRVSADHPLVLDTSPIGPLWNVRELEECLVSEGLLYEASGTRFQDFVGPVRSPREIAEILLTLAVMAPTVGRLTAAMTELQHRHPERFGRHHIRYVLEYEPTTRDVRPWRSELCGPQPATVDPDMIHVAMNLATHHYTGIPLANYAADVVALRVEAMEAGCWIEDLNLHFPWWKIPHHQRTPAWSEITEVIQSINPDLSIYDIIERELHLDKEEIERRQQASKYTGPIGMTGMTGAYGSTGAFGRPGSASRFMTASMLDPTPRK